MEHPLIVIGAGPIGLAAATHARQRGLRVVVLEAGSHAGSAVEEWGHVRLFSPWSELIDPLAEKLLTEAGGGLDTDSLVPRESGSTNKGAGGGLDTDSLVPRESGSTSKERVGSTSKGGAGSTSKGWVAPEPTAYPTGADWVRDYLRPLATALDATDEVDVRFHHRVTGVARRGRDVLVDAGRDTEPFTVHVDTPDGPQRLVASAVVDASGTWGRPSPLGTDGYPATGESEHADRIHYGMPDLADPAVRQRYAGKHVAVAGTGASAQNVLVDLARLAQDAPDTRVSWLVRRPAATFGGGEDDQLVERGALGRRAEQVAESPVVTTRTTFRTVAVTDDAAGRLRVESLDGQTVDGVDEVIVVTGFRPDLSLLSELRLDLDPVLQAPRELAPLIDPNVHSCGTVYPHGATELAQPEAGFYLAGMKSYGRAPSFLTLTGFEQVRSIVAAIAGDREAAERVELVLPESGVCGGAGAFGDDTAADGGGCCGTPAAPETLTIGSAR